MIDDYEPNKMTLDKYRNQRKHAWVLVKAGKRGEKTDYFIEPSTGRTCPIKEAQYVAIDCLFNHKNYWINLNQEKEICDINFKDMNNADSTEWEFIMLDTLELPPKEIDDDF